MKTAAASIVPEDVEVSAKARRRRFTAEDKVEVLRKPDACTKPGEIGALLRSEGLYSSHLICERSRHWYLAKVVAKIFSKAEGVAARKAGENVRMATQQAAKAVETAAHGGQNMLRHTGHELRDGSVGGPHYQT